MKTIILAVCFLLQPLFIYSQLSDISAGPAPVILNDNHINNSNIELRVGTRYFSQLSVSPNFQFGKAFFEGCTITNIGTPFPITFPGGLLFRNGILYTWNQSSPYQLWSIDTVSGTHTLVFNMTGVPQVNFTGMCWDGTNQYGLSTSLTSSQIFRVNMTTGACTPIGTPSSVCAGGIMLLGRPGAQYSLLVLDIVSDNLYMVNKTTGVFTLVGPLGADINFGQDGCVDPYDNAFYIMAYTTGPELRKLDTLTGGLGPVLCTYTSQGTGIACNNIAYAPPGQAFTFCRQNLNLAINDHSTVKDSVLVFPVIGDDCIVTDVNVRIDTVFHTWDSDLSFYLQRNTTGVKIINRVGSSGDNFLGTVLNDSASTPIASGTAPFTGEYIPSNPLSAFNGNGGINGRYWKLVVTDSATGDTGVLSKWCLVITMICPVGGIQTLEIPNYYHLDQNYPNPFNPATTIKFGIPESGNVKLVVYDITGREVKVLMNEYKHPGTYESVFDAGGLASGVYFYSLITQSGIDTRKMLLIK